MNKTQNTKKRRGWNDADARAFADGQRLRAATIPGKRKAAPSAREWN